MSEMLQAIILAVVQGVTEFVPVSSSAHLVIVPWLLGWPLPSLLFDTMLHWGTLLSILVVFWRDLVVMAVAMLRSIAQRSLADPNARLGWYVGLGTIPAVVVGLLFKDFIEALFTSPVAVGLFLFGTAAVLTLSEQLSKRLAAQHQLDRLSAWEAVTIGAGQALALAPGLSRSGMTIATGMITGLRRDEAARFSFLLGIPAFLGAGMLQLGDALATDGQQVVQQLPELIVGFIVSAVVGILVIRFLLAYLRRHSLYIFAVYCLVVGIGVLLVVYSGG